LCDFDEKLFFKFFVLVYSESDFVQTLLADNLCWIRSYSLYFSFLLPVGLLLLFNMVVFGIVITKLTCKKEQVFF